MIRALLKDSVVYSIPAIISRGISILLVPLYTRVLTPDDYGAFDMINVFASLVWLTVALEVTQAVARHYADEESTKGKVALSSTALWFTVGTHTLFMALAQLLAPVASLALLGVEGLTPIFRLGLVHIWLNGIYIALQNQFRWELRSKKYTVMSLIKVVTTASASVLLAYVVRLGISGLLLGLIAGTSLGGLYGLWNLRESFRFEFDFRRLKRMLTFSAPLVPSGMAVFVSHYIDRLMIAHFLSLRDLGLYGIGFRLSSIVSLVMVGFQIAITPLIYAHHADAKTPGQLATIFRLFLALAIPFVTVLVVFAPEMLRLFTTPDFYPAYRVVAFLAPGILLSNMYVFAPGLAIRKRTHWILWINLGGALLNATLNWVMIPRFGYEGAAFATVLGYLCAFVAYMVVSQRLYPVPHKWGRVLAAAVVFAGAAYAGTQIPLRGIGPFALRIVTILAVVAALLAAKLVEICEVRGFVRLIADRIRSLKSASSTSSATDEE